MRVLNDEQTRAITDETCFVGIACYRGTVSDGEFSGDLAGNAEDVERARRWLATDDDEHLRVRAPFVP